MRSTSDLISNTNPEAIKAGGVSSAKFAEIYLQRAPWEIGEPQPEIVKLERSGALKGDILDVGCGTGDNAIYLAQQGYRVMAIDFEEGVLNRACKNAQRLGTDVAFKVHNALELSRLDQRFDTVIDSATFHTFSDSERSRYPASLASIANKNAVFWLLSFSDREVRSSGPRRASIKEIADVFASHWDVINVQPVRYAVTNFEDGARMWLAELRLR